MSDSSTHSVRAAWADLASRGQQIADSIAQKYPKSEIAEALEALKQTVEHELEQMPGRTKKATTKVVASMNNLVATFSSMGDMEGKRPSSNASMYSHGQRYAPLDPTYKKSAGRSVAALDSTKANQRYLNRILDDLDA